MSGEMSDGGAEPGGSSTSLRVTPSSLHRFMDASQFLIGSSPLLRRGRAGTGRPIVKPSCSGFLIALESSEARPSARQSFRACRVGLFDARRVAIVRPSLAYQRSVVLPIADVHNRPYDEPVHEKTAGTSFFAD